MARQSNANRGNDPFLERLKRENNQAQALSDAARAIGDRDLADQMDMEEAERTLREMEQRGYQL